MSKKRLMTGLLAGGLMVGMLPGVASATPGDPGVLNFGQCKQEGGASGNIGPAVLHVQTARFHGPFNAANDRWLLLLACT
jgi:hypothetical protein